MPREAKRRAYGFDIVVMLGDCGWMVKDARRVGARVAGLVTSGKRGGLGSLCLSVDAED